MRIFISYSRTDQQIARRLAQDLQLWLPHAAVFYDVMIQPGSSWAEAIAQQMAQAHIVIAVMSPDYLESPWGRQEVNFAFERHLKKQARLLPLMVRTCEPDGFLRQLTWVDFTADYDYAFSHLLWGITGAPPGSSLHEKQNALNCEPSSQDPTEATGVRGAQTDPEGFLPGLIQREILDSSWRGDFSLETVSILVVDDEDGVRRTLAHFLGALNCTCHMASSASEAINIINSTRIDVLLSDVIMPGIDGIELSAICKAKNPDMRIILITGEPIREGEVFAYKIGCEAYLAKPVRKETLYEAVFRVTKSELSILVKQQCNDGPEINSLILSVRLEVINLLERFDSDRLVQVALRHMVKDFVFDYSKRVSLDNKLIIHTNLLMARIRKIRRLFELTLSGERIGISAFVRSLSEDALADHTNIVFNFSCSGDIDHLPSEVQAILVIGLVELTENAYDAILDSGRLEVSLGLRHSRNVVVLRVYNSGTTLPVDVVNRMFDRGFSTKGRGRGLGLYILRSLSMRIGGEISLNTARTEGVEFNLELPINRVGP